MPTQCFKCVSGRFSALLIISVSLGLLGCAPDNTQGVADAIRDYDAGRYTAALSKADSARMSGSTLERNEAAYVGGLAAAKLNRTSQARQLLEKASSSSDRTISARANASLGTVLLDDGEPLSAAKAFDRAAAKLDGAEANHALYLAGVAYREAGHAEQARRRFAQSAKNSDGTMASRASNAIDATGFAIQAGAYSDQSNARRCAEECSAAAAKIGLGPARIVAIRRNGRLLYVVQVGSFSTRQDAEYARRRLGTVEGTITRVEAIAVPEN